jgi:hypothetical protein
MEEATDGKLVVATRTSGHWRRAMGWEGGWSLSGACRCEGRTGQLAERPVRMEALMDMVVALETLPSAAALTMRQSRPMLEEGVAPMAQLERSLEARQHGTMVASDAAKSEGARRGSRARQS